MTTENQNISSVQARRVVVLPSLPLEEFLTQRCPHGADQTMILKAGFRGNELRAAVERGDVEMRDGWVFSGLGSRQPGRSPTKQLLTQPRRHKAQW